jgi:hypothetical protein
VIVLQVLILITLVAIFIQDIQSRSVYWILFPLLSVLLVALRLSIQSLYEAALCVGINLGFLVFQLILLSAYFSLRQGRWVSLTNGWLGWGDLLFLAACASYLSIFSFVAFYICSLIVVLGYWTSYRAVSGSREIRIPLAGMQALLFAILLTIDWWCCQMHVYADDWLLRYL